MFSLGIESVVDEDVSKSSGGSRDAMCSTCEMAVVWMQNQLQQNQTQEHVLNYVNEVGVVYIFQPVPVIQCIACLCFAIHVAAM